MDYLASPYLALLKNRLDLQKIPFSDRGSRLLVFHTDHSLSIRLAERWFKREGQLSAYRQRPPIVDNFQFIDLEGNPIPFEVTTYPHCLEFHTISGVFTMLFLDTETIMLLLPAGKCGVAFRASLDKATPDRRGGVLRLTGEIRRNFAYTTNAHILSHRIDDEGVEAHQIRLYLEAKENSALVLNITPRLGFNRYIPEPQRMIEASAKRWHEWFAAAPAVQAPYQAQYYFAWWVMGAGLISTRFYTTREAMTPSKMHYVGVWQWDAFFHAIAYRYVNARLAQDQLRILLDHQREDGMIPDAVHDEGTVTHLTFPVDADVTKPPLIAWAAWKLFEQDGDREFLDEIFEPIVRWNEWWFTKNDLNHNGLCEYLHPYSSGLDDSPLWDAGVPVEAPDLNTYLCLQQDYLSRIAREIGDLDASKMWADKSKAMIERMIRLMWDDEAGLFWALKDGQPVKVRTPFNLFPLITGRLPAKISQRLVAHLTDPNQFWPRYPVPTVALDDPKYDPMQMWRGPTWVNVNYLLIDGLINSGYTEIARQLRRVTLELIAGQNNIYEYYHPQTGANPPKAASVFGWSSAVYIDLAIQASREEP
jgi:putative isomerase